MKIKLYRKSGRPVSLSDRQEYENAWKAFFDKVATRFANDMAKQQRAYNMGERALIKKHNIQVEVDLPKSEKAWKRLMDQYEQVPIMLAVNSKDGSLLGVLMDEFGQ